MESPGGQWVLVGDFNRGSKWEERLTCPFAYRCILFTVSFAVVYSKGTCIGYQSGNLEIGPSSHVVHVGRRPRICLGITKILMRLIKIKVLSRNETLHIQKMISRLIQRNFDGLRPLPESEGFSFLVRNLSRAPTTSHWSNQRARKVRAIFSKFWPNFRKS